MQLSEQEVHVVGRSMDSMKKAYDFLRSTEISIELSFIKGFKRVLKGTQIVVIPIHYPRRTNPKPDPDGKNYEWFMDNENGRSGRVAGITQDGKQIALPRSY